MARIVQIFILLIIITTIGANYFNLHVENYFYLIFPTIIIYISFRIFTHIRYRLKRANALTESQLFKPILDFDIIYPWEEKFLDYTLNIDENILNIKNDDISIFEYDKNEQLITLNKGFVNQNVFFYTDIEYLCFEFNLITIPSLAKNQNKLKLLFKYYVKTSGKKLTKVFNAEQVLVYEPTPYVKNSFRGKYNVYQKGLKICEIICSELQVPIKILDLSES